MTELSELQKSLVDRCTYLRGRILTSYAQVEFLLADISVKLDLHFPYPVKERIKTAKHIADRPGFEVYRDELVEVCEKLLEFEELRRLMAHGFVTLTTDRHDNHMFDFRLYQRNSKNNFQLLQVYLDISHMEYNAESIRLYVNRAVDLFSRIYLEKRLEDPKGDLLIGSKDKPA